MSFKKLAVLALGVAAVVILAGCIKSTHHKPATANIKVTLNPTVFYVNEPQVTTATITELNGVGVDLNYLWVKYYNEQGNFVSEWGRTGDDARRWFDEQLGTHYLPGHGQIEGTIEEQPFDAPGTQDLIIGGTDDNGHEVQDTVKITLIERGS